MTKIMKGGVAYNSTSNIVALTQAEYNALSTAQKNNGNFYCITDADPSYFSAENIDYDNTDSGLSAINIQDAIDEVVSGTINTADMLPITSGSATNTKAYIDSAISGLVIPNKIITESLITATTLTTTRTDYNTYSSRKFSDYDVLVFKIGYVSDDCRKSIVIPQNNWYSGASIIDQIIHGASVSTITSYEVSNFTITYKSDTSITAIVGGSGVMNKLRVYGLRLGAV